MVKFLPYNLLLYTYFSLNIFTLLFSYCIASHNYNIATVFSLHLVLNWPVFTIYLIRILSSTYLTHVLSCLTPSV